MRRSPVLAGALAAATAIALAAPAYADNSTDATDQQFLAALNKAGIAYHNPADAIKEAKSVCGLLKDKKSAVDVVDELTKANQGTSTSTAYDFTVIAAGAYCPKEIQGGGGK
jgi:hypothetical protein